jgi:hypothetical protein
LEVEMKRIDVVKKGDGWGGESGGRTVPTYTHVNRSLAKACARIRQT